MTFKTPSPLHYFGSLIIAALLTSLAYWLLGAQGLDGDPLVILGAGLLIGHLIGICTHSSARTPAPTTQAATHATNNDTAADSDTISLYVGNLAYSVQREALHDLFTPYGTVHSVRIMTDRATRRPRGYGFVEMESSAARKAQSKLDNTDFCGRNLRVSEAKQRSSE